MRRSLALAAMSLALAIGSCQHVPDIQAPGPTPVVDHVEEARRALAAENWAVAAEHLRAAIQKEPDNLFLHTSLAISATWLDAHWEATREFEWVVAHAPADSEEARTARGWLAANPRGTETAGAPTDAPSRLRGLVMWAGPEQAPTPQAHVELLLIGLPDSSTEGLRYVRTSTRGGRYEFRDVAAGPYELTGAIDGPGKWRLKVELKPGEDVALDLTPENSVSVRDDFPGR